MSFIDLNFFAKHNSTPMDLISRGANLIGIWKRIKTNDATCNHRSLLLAIATNITNSFVKFSENKSDREMSQPSENRTEKDVEPTQQEGTEDAKIGSGKNSPTATAANETSPAAKRQRQQRMLNVAVAGCSHGQMDTIYAKLTEHEQRTDTKLDLLICCGDFQAVRNHGDLHHFHAPLHHRKLGTFYKYYNGEKIAPILTLFVGGNHESSGYMAELPNGGWVAPNIYYMGYASVVRFGGLRIAGLSGIYKPRDYNRGHFERPPFREQGSIVSAYHVRSVDVFRLRQLRDIPMDICVSHDWPAGITDFGDRDTLLRIKPHFTEDVQNNALGNPATMNLIHELKPSHWFAAHMHVRFTAAVTHSEQSVTRFLALDKPNDNPRRRFVDFLQIPIAEDVPLELSYDPHWLAILRSTDDLTDFTDKSVYMPGEGPGSSQFRASPAEIETVLALFGGGDLCIPLNFQQTAPPEREPWNAKGRPQSLYYRNPQSQQFCERLGIRDLNLLFAQASANHLGIPHFLHQQQQPRKTEAQKEGNPDEIDLGEDGDEFGGEHFVVDVKGAK